MFEGDREFIEIFVEEAMDFIENLNYLIPKLEKEPQNKEVINEIFRIMHSLKGNAATLGINEISEIAHKAEDLLDLVRKDRVEINKKIIDVLYRVADTLSKLLDELSTKGMIESDTTDIIKEIQNIITSIEGEKISESSSGEQSTETRSGSIKDENYVKEIEKEAESALEFLRSFKPGETGNLEATTEIENVIKDVGLLQPSPKDEEKESVEPPVSKEEWSPPKDLYNLTDMEKQKLAETLAKGYNLYVLRLKFTDASMLVIRYFQALQKLGERGDIIKTIPSGQDVIKKSTDTIYVLIGVKKLEDLEDAIKEINDLAEYNLKKVDASELGVDVKSITVQKPVDTISELESLFKKIEEVEETPTSETESPDSKKLEEVRVNVKSLDVLFNLAGELVLVKSRLLSIANQYDIQPLKEVLVTFERLVNELQNEIMQMRLVPLHHIFKRLPRLVSEYSEKYNKEVDIYYAGGEIALDRKVLEELANPLFKVIEIMIRDDIEDPETRKKKGKPSIGTVKVIAYREGNHVIITIESDGRGMDPEEITRRAVELGLIPASTIEKMTTEEMLMLVTLPGFSLKNNMWSGFDEVKHSIESLGGSMEIHSKVDEELKVVFKIPVSMATLRALLVKLGEYVYAIPVSVVSTTMKIENLNDIGSSKVIKYQGKLIAIHDLAQLLNVHNGGASKNYIVIIEKQGKYIGFSVDEILGQEDIVVKPLNKLLSNVKGFSGATILGDGKVCLIIDPTSLI